MILLEAFQKLIQSRTDIKLVFVGAPPPNQENFQEDLEKKIAEYQLENNVMILPFQNEIQKIWQSIDIAVVPSTEPEPFGMVAIEAMLAQKPVVASNHGGLSEIVEDNKTGFLVQPNDQQELVFALEKLLQNQELRTQMGKNGFHRVIHQFSVEQYVQSFEKLFENIVV